MAGWLQNERLPPSSGEKAESMIFITANTPAKLLKLRFISVDDGQVGQSLQASNFYHSYRKVSDNDEKAADEWLTMVNCLTQSNIRKANLRRSASKNTTRSQNKAGVYTFMKEHHSGTFHEMIPVINTVQMVAPEDNVNEVYRWLEEEHIGLLSKIPGWQRSRRFRLIAHSNRSNSSKDKSVNPQDNLVELLLVHEFATDRAFASEEFLTAYNTKWSEDTRNSLEDFRSRVWSFEMAGPSL